MAKNKAALIEKPAPVEDAGDVIAQAVTPEPAPPPEVCGNMMRCFRCTRFPHAAGPHQYFEDGRLIATWN